MVRILKLNTQAPIEVEKLTAYQSRASQVDHGGDEGKGEDCQPGPATDPVDIPRARDDESWRRPVSAPVVAPVVIIPNGTAGVQSGELVVVLAIVEL